MQSDEDAQDFLDSLLVFDRICPFALGNLPVMSRRVFDVGLDMGRIKSGMRLTKENKRGKVSRSGSTSYVDQSPDENQSLALKPQLHRERSTPPLQSINSDDFPPNHQPVLLSSPTSPEPTMHRDFPLPPSHKSSSPESGESSTQGTSVDPDPRSSVADPSQSFDLRPPPPNKGIKLLDTQSDSMFSGDHLTTILRDPAFFLRFTAFLNRYKPHSAPVLVRYLETQKAMKAVEYANSVAYSIKPLPGDPPNQSCPAASVDPRFEARAKKAFDQLVHDALPMYITHTLVKVVTEYMVREITGTTMPMMRELVGGLAEVFCLSDPSLRDNPIVYASEEFYRTTQYGRDYAIGRNCRFLQGPKTNRQCVARLSAALKAGQQISETILNYRRDGSPFMNLLMIAPLYDNRGNVRYFLGAQVDVSGLVEEGRGLETFARYLEDKAQYRKRDNDPPQESASKKSLRTLNEFGQMLSLDESAIFQSSHSRCSSMHSNGNGSITNYPTRTAPQRREGGTRYPRRVLGNDESHEEDDRNAWAFSSMGPSGKLPGVYQNYLLVRPYPSLRIIFVSPALRIPGLLQSSFLSRIGGPSHVRDGLSDAFEAGAAVTAKVLWLPQGRPDEEDASRPGARRTPGAHYANISNSGWNGGDGSSRTRYISCTPLLGSDDQVGVWMVVMVENEQVTGTLASREAAWRRFGEAPPTPSEYERDEDTWSGPRRGKRTDSAEPGMMYAEFLRAQHGNRGKVGLGGGESERDRDRDREHMMANSGREREGMVHDGGDRDGMIMNGGRDRDGMILNGGRDRDGMILNSGRDRDGMILNSGRDRGGMIVNSERERDGIMNGEREREGMIGGRDRDRDRERERDRDGMMIGIAEGMEEEERAS